MIPFFGTVSQVSIPSRFHRKWDFKLDYFARLTASVTAMSTVGWAASVMYHDKVKNEFERFYARKDTFSLGVCNGCQLMTMLGWVGGHESGEMHHKYIQTIYLHSYYNFI